jgi:hypothetical protein
VNKGEVPLLAAALIEGLAGVSLGVLFIQLAG